MDQERAESKGTFYGVPLSGSTLGGAVSIFLDNIKLHIKMRACTYFIIASNAKTYSKA